MTTQSPHTNPDLAPLIARALTGLRGKIRRYISIEGLALCLAWLGLGFWLSLALDWLPVTFGYDELSLGGRLTVLGIVAAVLLFIVFWLIVRRLKVSMPDRSMAVLLERRFRDYDDALMTTVEMHEAPDHAEKFNPDMLRHTGELAAEQTGHVHLSQVFNPWPLVRNLLLAVVFVGSVAGFAVANAEAFETWMKRFLLLSADTKWPRHNRVAVEGEYPRKIARGDDITIVVKADGRAFELPRNVRVEYESDEGAAGTETMTRVGEVVDGFQEYNYTFRGLLHSVAFEVVGGDYRVRGEEYRIEVVDSPTADLVLHVDYPSYTDLAPTQLPVSGTMELPRGSRVRIVGTANKPLVEAGVEVTYGELSEKPKLRTSIPLASSEAPTFEYEIVSLDQPQDLRFSLTDVDGIRTRQPILLSLTAIEDNPPQLEVVLRGVGEAVTPQVKIPFEGKITDEYGVKQVLIEWHRAGQDPQLIPFKRNPKNRQEFVFSRELAKKANIDEEALDFQLLAYQMRKKLGLKVKEPEDPPPKRKPGEKLPDPKEEGDPEEADPKAKDPAKKAEEDPAAKYTLEPGQTFTIRVIARDGCTLSRPAVEGYSTVFGFKVVTPDELRTILAARELIQRSRFEKIRDEVMVTRNSLSAIDFKPPAAKPPAKAPGKAPGKKADDEEKGREVTAEDQRLEAFLRAQRAQQIAAKNAIEVLEVAGQFELIREELINNRLYNDELNKRLKLGIVDPLDKIGNEAFKEFDELLNDLIEKCDKGYDNAPARDRAAKLAVGKADDILVAMDAVLVKMLEFEAFNEAIRLLQEIIKDQDTVNRKTKKGLLQ